jgi:VanZ family protein
VKPWLLAVVWAALLFALSARPAQDLPTLFVGADKLVHLALYAPLGWWLARGFGVGWVAVLVATAYGVTDEWHQSFVPGRMASIADIGADAVGAALGAWMAMRRSSVAGGAPR